MPKTKEYSVYYSTSEDGVYRSISLPAMTKKEAKDIAEVLTTILPIYFFGFGPTFVGGVVKVNKGIANATS